MVEVEDKRTKSAFSKLKNSEVLKKLKNVKNIEFIACVFILAIALLLFSLLNGSTKSGDKQTEVSTSSSGTEIEKRLENILEQIEGAGDVSVMITYESEVSSGGGNEISGVLVVSSGAENIKVRLNLLQAVKTALNVDVKIVEIFDK